MCGFFLLYWEPSQNVKVTVCFGLCGWKVPWCALDEAGAAHQPRTPGVQGILLKSSRRGSERSIVQHLIVIVCQTIRAK